jgi:hypothetical protein
MAAMTGDTIRRVTQITVMPDVAALFEPSVTQISIDDEAGGEFVTVTQRPDSRPEQRIAIDPGEWPVIRDAIDELIKECRG